MIQKIKTMIHAKYVLSKQVNPHGVIDNSYSLFSRLRMLGIRFEQRRKTHLLPTNLNVELTTLCNLRCSYCVNKNMKVCGNMDPKVISKVVEEFTSISNQRGVSLAPVGVGEPLLFPGFFDAIKWFKHVMPHVPLFVITNGVVLNKENCKKVIKSGIDRFLISLNFNDKSSYLEYNGVDRYDVVVKNTKMFLKMKGNNNPATSIQMLDITSNKPCFQQFVKQWTPYLNPNDTVTLKVCDNWTGTIDRTKFTDTKPPDRYPCPMLYSMVIINKDGYIFPCCQGMTRGPESALCLGNILDKTIKQIYTQEDTIWNLRRLHERGSYDGLPCKDCFAWSMVPNIFFTGWKHK